MFSSLLCLKLPRDPLKWQPLAFRLFPPPLPPHHHTKCLLFSLPGACHMGRNSCTYEVLPINLVKDYLLGEFQRLSLPIDILG